ncbi:MAG: hypothetical protein HZA49_10480 [Planctomycetes bacterium]|nr:hypothetical protein [Planctomycetota bacterium]
MKGDKFDDEDASYTEKFDNLCFDKGGQKPADINGKSSPKDRFLLLIDCLLPILRRKFTQDEIDFMLAYRANRGDRYLTANAMDIAPKTVDGHRTCIMKKIHKLSRVLIRFLGLGNDSNT